MKDIKNIFKILKVCLLILLVLIYTSLPINIFNIDFNSLSMTMQTVYYLACNLSFMLILFLIYRKVLIKDAKAYFKDFQNNFEISFKYWLIGAVIMFISNFIIALFFTQATANNEEAVRSMANDMPLYMLFSASIYAPFVEELVFRKSFREIFPSKYVYIIMSGFIFGALHVVSSITNAYDLLYLIPYTALGISFSALYAKTDNICSSMTMHSFHNTAAMLIYLIGRGLL